MENCLVTKLKATVSNNNLEVLGAIRMEAVEVVGSTNDYYIALRTADGPVKIEIKGNGALQTSAALLISDPLQEITIPANSGNQNIYFTNGTYTILIHNKYELKQLFIDYTRGGALIHLGDIAKLRYSTKLNTVSFDRNAYVTGNVRDLLDCMAGSITFNAPETALTGEIKATDTANVKGTKCFGDFTYMLQNSVQNDRAFQGYYLGGTEYIADGNLTGDFSVIPDNVYFIIVNPATIYAGNTDEYWNVSWKGTRSSSAKILGLKNLNFGTDLDAMLVNQANCVANGASSGGSTRIIVKGTHTESDATWQAAVATLKQKGMTVTINGEVQ